MHTQFRNALDAKLVHNLMDSVTDVLGIMAGTSVTLQDVKPVKTFKFKGDISSVIGISGDHGEGIFALSFSEMLTKLMVSRLLGIPKEDVQREDMIDGMGELINMISGRTKVALSQEDNTLYSLSLPSVVLGEGTELETGNPETSYLLLSFDIEGELFHLQVNFQTY
jgi:chemotaxis protein CheX